MASFLRARAQLRDEDFCQVPTLLNTGTLGTRKAYSRLAILDSSLVGEERGSQKYVFQSLNGKGIDLGQDTVPCGDLPSSFVIGDDNDTKLTGLLCQ